MGKGLCCANTRDPIYDLSIPPNLLKEIINKSKWESIHDVYCVEKKTSNKKYWNCATYSETHQCRGDKPRISPPKKLNVEFPVPVEEFEVERKMTIPNVLRRQSEASVKLSLVETAESARSSVSTTESARDLSLRKNIKQRSWQYQDSENPSADINLKTSRIPDEVVTALSGWLKSEKIGLEALIKKLGTDVQLKAQSTTSGYEMSRKKCHSDFEIQRSTSSINLTPDKSSITSTSSTISKQPLAWAPNRDRWNESRTWMDDVNYASYSSDCSSEELIHLNEEELFSFLKTKQERSERRSLFAGKIFANLPQLSHEFKEISRGSWTDVNEEQLADKLPVVSQGTEKKSSTGSLSLIIADIDLLEQSIKEKIERINELREQSVNILTTGCESDVEYESRGNTTVSVWLDVEKKVSQLEDEKLDLEKKKDAFVSQLQCLNYLKHDVLQNCPFPLNKDRALNTRFMFSNSAPPSRNCSARLRFSELSFEESYHRPPLTC